MIQSEFLLFSISQNADESARVRIVEFFKEKFQVPFSSDDFYSAEILQKICENHSKYNVNTKKILNYFNFVEEKNGLEFLKNYISGKNSESQTILFYFCSISDIAKVLEWLEEKFKNVENFLEDLKNLLQVDENGDSFLHVLLKKFSFSEHTYCITKTFEFLIRNFDKSFVQNFLLIQNN